MSLASTGKPNISGAIYVAPVGTTLPTDTSTALDAAFEALGYVSEDGVTNDNTPTVENIKAWGGDIILTPVSSREDTFTFTLLEVMNPTVLEMVYGTSNVSGTLATGISIAVNNKQLGNYSVVIEMVLADNGAMRIVIPSACVSEVGTITYKDDEAIGYETTLTCQPDSSGNTHYEYIKRT